MSDFAGNFFLALLLCVLARVLYAVCAALIRSGDRGNVAFAIALPLILLYIPWRNPVPIGNWTGFAAGLGVGLMLIVLAAFCRRAR